MVATAGLLRRLSRLRTCRRRCAAADDAACTPPSKRKRNARATTSATKHTRVLAAGAIEQRSVRSRLLASCSCFRGSPRRRDDGPAAAR